MRDSGNRDVAHRRRSHLEVCVRSGRQPPEKTPHIGDKIQRHLDHDALLGRARGGDGEELFRREMGQISHRYSGGEFRAAPGLVRCRGRLQSVRRYFVGPWACMYGHHRHRAVRQPQPGTEISLAVRTGPWIGTGHLRKGHCQSGRPDMVGGDDARSPWRAGSRQGDCLCHRDCSRR